MKPADQKASAKASDHNTDRQSNTKRLDRKGQYWQVLEHLQKHGSATTVELQDLYNIIQAPSIIRDIRKLYVVITHIVLTADEDGVLHRCAKYEYRGRKQ